MRSHIKEYHPDAPSECECLCVGRPKDPLCDTCRRYQPGPKGPNHFIITPMNCKERLFYKPR